MSQALADAVWAAAYIAVLTHDAEPNIHRVAEQVGCATFDRMFLAIAAADDAVSKLRRALDKLS